MVSAVALFSLLLQTIYGKSRMLQVLLRMADYSSLGEDALGGLLVDVLADETTCPLSKKEACEFVVVSHWTGYFMGIAALKGRHGGCAPALCAAGRFGSFVVVNTC